MEKVEHIITRKPSINYRLERQRRIGEALDKLVDEQIIKKWIWEYDEKKNGPWYRLTFFYDGDLLTASFDTRSVEIMLLGAKLLRADAGTDNYLRTVKTKQFHA